MIAPASPEFDALLARLRNMRPAWKLVADALRAAFRENFDAGGRPQWTPLRPSTLASKAARGYPANPLVASGKLRDSVTVEGAPGHIENLTEKGGEIGSSLPTFAFHEKGTKPHLIRARNAPRLAFIGDKGQLVFAKEVKHPGTPAREMLTITNDDAEQIAQTLLSHLVGEAR